MNVSMTKPFNTATPDKAINPTPADIESGISLSHKATNPPDKAKGTPLNTSKLSLKLLNTAISNRS